MNKNTFLTHLHVTGFISFLSRVITGEQALNHSYYDRRLNNDLYFPTLHDAITQYHFAGMDLADNEQQIEEIIEEFSIANKGGRDYETPSLSTLFWGAGNREGKLYTSNKKWIDAQDDYEQLIQDALLELKKDAPNFDLFKNRYRMNAGFTKIFAFMSPDDFIIYDSRVAGCLGYLVALYYDSLRDGEQIDDALNFHLAEAQGNSNRTKVSHQHEFPKLYNRSHLHALSNVKANWIIAEALNIAQQKECHFTSVRDVEAAMFMIGYDFPEFVRTTDVA